MPNESLVTAERVADHFGVSVGTVNAWVRKRLIPFVRVTRKTVRFSIAEVETALRSVGPDETSACEEAVRVRNRPTARSAPESRAARRRFQPALDPIASNRGGRR